MDLGRVKALWGRHRTGGSWTGHLHYRFWGVCQHFPAGSGPEAASRGLGVLCEGRRAQASDNDYAFIAARRGWTPMMFMTRVRL